MSPKNHTFPVRLGTLGMSRAYWSLSPNGKILLFVHGFGGNATGTWRDFLELLLNDQEFAGSDIFFYGYDSRRARALKSADMLFDFADPFLRNPAVLVNQGVSAKRKSDFQHSEIFIISHSLGAPIARTMLLKAWKEKSPWLPRVKLIFFAPATAGARDIKQLVRSAGWPFTLLFSYFGYRWPVMDDVPVGSPFLKDLGIKTRQAIASKHRAIFQSLGTYFGALEEVVDTRELPWDAPYITIPGLYHCNVCKPRCPQDAAYGYLKQLVTKVTG